MKNAMSNGHIFISYRRDDSAGYARAIYDQFVQHFSIERVFMDVDAIEPGHPFDEAIERAVGQCEILLAVIGKRWLGQQAGTSPRINDPKDYVRLEIGAALSRNIRVVPVLLDGASMPTEEELPEPLRALARRNAIEISNSRFKSDVERLIAAVRKALGKPDNPMQKLYWIVGAFAAGALSVIISTSNFPVKTATVLLSRCQVKR
ncbi:MAG: toll/interleukin-1 receptor domain-containing protein [Burkholderiales bacterium]|nr:toll/interleukin-1 receptor domain-containing protein [Burkholderiales bacterium]